MLSVKHDEDKLCGAGYYSFLELLRTSVLSNCLGERAGGQRQNLACEVVGQEVSVGTFTDEKC